VIRENIGLIGAPFDAFLAMVERPDEIAGIGGYHCIAEEIISAGHQYTLEGYVHRGEVVVYGVVDSIRSGKHRSCFARYEYPSRLPGRVRERMIEATTRFLTRIGYDDAPFNAEFYWHPQTDSIRALEVNTRISKSHCPLFLMVDGATHQKVAVEVALGRRPDFPHREGRHRVAAKFMLRVFEDGIVERVPDPADIDRLRQRFPEALIRVLVKQGTRLAHMRYQDSYSFEIAEIFLGADSQHALLEKYRAALDMLPFRIAPEEAVAG
jgi:biotin carboxylase